MKRFFVADFETTVTGDPEQAETEVWAAGIVEFNTEDCMIFSSINAWWNYLLSISGDLVVYFHNLKFDGSFIIDFFLRIMKYEQAFYEGYDERIHKVKPKEMLSKTFNYSISEMGQWYTINIKINGRMIEFRDSLKLLPFSVAQIGKAFQTKHQKLEMDYVGNRHAYGFISELEREYLKNDLLVVKEALEIMFEQGHNGLTIGACCVKEYKTTIMKSDFDTFFPDLTNFELDEEQYGYPDADAYIRKAYRGGWCYLVKKRAGKLIGKGTTADVNSLYPSQMHSESGNRYPIYNPVFWHGDYIPDEAKADNMLYFIRIRTRFHIRDGYLPFIQIKDNLLYKGTESLETSDIMGKDGKYYPYYIDRYGVKHEAIVTLTLTQMDFEMMQKHYVLSDTEILDGCYFYTISGIFDEYIDNWRKVKENSKGAIRTIAKLFSNNLYGKLGTSRNSSFKTCRLDNEGEPLHFEFHAEQEKKVFYIAAAACVTSYARRFTITAAQANYHPGGHGFIYADTDSIHCDLDAKDIVGIKVHDTHYNHWKLETSWDHAIFLRQKTYLEHVTHENLEPIEKPFYDVKCAGMPSNCKKLFLASCGEEVFTEKEFEKLDDNEKNYINYWRKEKRDISSFRLGLVVPSKLMAHRVRGGIVLVKTDFEIRG